MKKLILVLILLNTNFISADEVSDSINKLLEQESCRLNDSSYKKETKDIENIIGWVNQGMTFGSLETTQNILNKKILSKDMKCFYRINYTSLYAKLLYKLKDYEKALTLYKKVSDYRGLNKEYKKHIKNMILETESKIRTKKVFNTSIKSKSSEAKTNATQESLIINNLRSLLENSMEAQEKLISQVDIAATNIQKLENKIQVQIEELKIQRNEISSLSELRDNKKEVREMQDKNNQENLSSIYWVMIIGFGTLILMQIFFSFKEDTKKNSSNNTLPEANTNKDLLKTYSKKRN